MDRPQRPCIGGERVDAASAPKMQAPVILQFEDKADTGANDNDKRDGPAACVWIGDADRTVHVSCRSRVGTVLVNGRAFDRGSPFGGCRRSGVGRDGRMTGLEECLESRTLQGLN